MFIRRRRSFLFCFCRMLCIYIIEVFFFVWEKKKQTFLYSSNINFSFMLASNRLKYRKII